MINPIGNCPQFAIFALLVCAPCLTSAEDVRRIPPDRSLSISEYIDRGIPDPTGEWTSADRTVAREVLWRLRERDPTRLPRAENPRSGTLFRRILDEEFHSDAFDVFEDLPAGQILDLLSGDAEEAASALRSRSFTGIYRPQPGEDFIFERELVEVGAASLHSVLQAYGKLAELQKQKDKLCRQDDHIFPESCDDPDWAADIEDMIVGLFVRLAATSLSAECSEKTRAAGIQHLEAIVVESSDILGHESQKRIRQALALAHSAHDSAKAPQP